MKWHMKFIENGNFSFILITVFFLSGLIIFFINLFIFDSIILMSIGLFLSAIGGYSSKANQLNIKPFDNEYKKARDSYHIDDAE